MNSIPINCVYVDVRKVYDDVSKKVTAEKLLDKLHSSLVSLSKKEKLKKALSELKISVESPLRTRISRERFRREAIRIFEALNTLGKTVVAFDEAQYLRFSTVGLRPLLTYIYDPL
jgi:TnpA family transposase